MDINHRSKDSETRVESRFNIPISNQTLKIPGTNDIEGEGSHSSKYYEFISKFLCVQN